MIYTGTEKYLAVILTPVQNKNKNKFNSSTKKRTTKYKKQCIREKKDVCFVLPNYFKVFSMTNTVKIVILCYTFYFKTFYIVFW